ncbi:ABC transporter permease [Brachybacterium nesterenkovii]|uniref:ABC transporter permease protein n=1 Tax=Brachybacterium nesterenkovii TaxID=47847 RepID=A0A1X6X4J8_9MICO|nr:ABC transporter permease [Brachybacterium nesterenkovii]SLM93758.1 ABC transporter permease protein [Brachybacterium nesterenkovii]
MTGLIASIVEAYGELRVSKGRILLSLLGVAFSVFALTTVMSGGQMLEQSLKQSVESFGGRPAVLTVQPMGDMGADGGSGGRATVEDMDRAVLEQFDQMGITERSRDLQGTLRVQTGSGVVAASGRGVDPGWGPMHRVDVLQGRWFADSDEGRLSPAIVVDETLYEKLGRPELGAETVDLVADKGATAPVVVIGVVPANEFAAMGMDATVYISASAADDLPAGSGMEQAARQYLAWVPEESAEEVASQLSARLTDAPTGSYDAYRMDGAGDIEAFRYVRYALMGVAAVILVLGAMGLVNIALVTIRYRVREIGIRRSYGATGLRIFIGVLMESVVATVIAGIVGVTAAVALVKAPFVTEWFHSIGLVDVPPFPTTAVITGLTAATAVGILAGALPAIIATRIKVIDAIRS